MLTDFREGGREGEREGEKHRRERETSIGCLLYVPDRGLNPQPRHALTGNQTGQGKDPDFRMSSWDGRWLLGNPGFPPSREGAGVSPAYAAVPVSPHYHLA